MWRLRAILASYCLTRALFSIEQARLMGRYGYRVDRDISLGRALQEMEKAEEMWALAHQELMGRAS